MINDHFPMRGKRLLPIVRCFQCPARLEVSVFSGGILNQPQVYKSIPCLLGQIVMFLSQRRSDGDAEILKDLCFVYPIEKRFSLNQGSNWATVHGRRKA